MVFLVYASDTCIQSLNQHSTRRLVSCLSNRCDSVHSFILKIIMKNLLSAGDGVTSRHLYNVVFSRKHPPPHPRQVPDQCLPFVHHTPRASFAGALCGPFRLRLSWPVFAGSLAPLVARQGREGGGGKGLLVGLLTNRWRRLRCKGWAAKLLLR